MARQLVIMRHAKSAWDTEAATDFERPLAKRGRGDAPRVGQWLLEQDLIPDYIVSSPAERAKQTTLRACKPMDIKKTTINWDPRVYGAGTEDLLEVLAEIPCKKSRILMVGHNPGLEFLFSFLTKSGDEIDPEITPIKTATVVVLDMPDSWKNIELGCATAIKIQYPRDLPPLKE